MTEPRFSDLPATMRHLPLDHRGFPVPWFVAWKDGEPIFPAMDHSKLLLASLDRLCWVCGGRIERIGAFVIGPMCAVNRVNSEPPSHLQCARFSARRCPFLSNPRMGRVPLDHYGGTRDNVAGTMIERNPGVTLVWQSLRWSIFNDGRGGFLFDIGKPHQVEYYREGRIATRAEVEESIVTGLPALEAACRADPDPVSAFAALGRQLTLAHALLPADGKET
jgi:hypothetical protein